MRGTVRLGAISLVIGLLFLAVAQTDAKAMPPISVNEFGPFPESVLGSSQPGHGIIIAFNQMDNFHVSSFSLDDLEDAGGQLPPGTFGLFVAAANHGLDIFPFTTDGENNGNGGSVGGGVGGGGENAPPPFSNGNGGPVTHAPEPATWLMMIFGFGIVAWRLRHRQRKDFEPVATPV